MAPNNGNRTQSDAQSTTTETVRGPSLAVKVSLILALLGLGKVASMSRRGAVGTAEMRMVGIVLAEVFLLIVALVNVDYVFNVMLFYLPFSQRLPGDYGTAINITNILILIVIFGLFLRSVREGGAFFVKTDLDRLIGVWLLLLFISFFRSAMSEKRDWFLLLTLVKRFCTPIFIYYLAAWVIRDRRGIANAVFIIMLTTLMVAILATKDTVTPTHFSWERREAGVVNQANILAAFLVYYMFYFFSYTAVNASNPRYWLLLPALYPCLRAVLITFSRGGYVALATSALFISFMTKKALFIAVLVALVVVLARPHLFLPGAVVERLQGTVIKQQNVYSGKESETLERSAESRLQIWKAGLRMIVANPVLGVGYGQFPMRLPEYGYGAYMDAHNGYILIAAEMGLPALFVFLMLMGKLFKYALDVYRGSADKLYAGLGLGFATGVVGLWTANIFGSRFNTTETMSYFWVLGALVMLIRRMESGVATEMAARAEAGEVRARPAVAPGPAVSGVNAALTETGQCRFRSGEKERRKGSPKRR